MKPKRFDVKTIDEVTETLIDYRGKTPRKTESGVKLITAKVIKDGRIVRGRHECISEANYDSWMRRGLPKQGDILITTEAPLGEVAQLKTSEKIALAQRVILLRGNQSLIDRRYYFYALRSPFVQAGLYCRATGTTVLGIKQSELRQVEIPYYPLPTQQKIAAILSAYDDLIENNNRRIEILEEMARMLYREWFVKFRYPGHESDRFYESELGLIPEGWEVVKITDALYVNPKTSLPKDNEKPFVTMKNVSNNSMLINGFELRSGNSGSKFKNGDTLFARITPCLEAGKTAYVQFLRSDKEVAFGSTEFIVLRSKTLNPEYVYFTAREPGFRENAIKSMVGASGRQRVQLQCFDNFLIAHPDKNTLAKFSRLASAYFREIHVLYLKNNNLRKTRDLLLPRLISGEIDVENLDIKGINN
jgi:type I restriction enzyme S subunit